MGSPASNSVASLVAHSRLRERGGSASNPSSRTIRPCLRPSPCSSSLASSRERERERERYEGGGVLHVYDMRNNGLEEKMNTILQINKIFKDRISLGGMFHSAIQIDPMFISLPTISSIPMSISPMLFIATGINLPPIPFFGSPPSSTAIP